ncbi:hypothetical protein ACOME3_010035 [Neoechinorhynchus agilis]
MPDQPSRVPLSDRCGSENRYGLRLLKQGKKRKNRRACDLSPPRVAPQYLEQFNALRGKRTPQIPNYLPVAHNAGWQCSAIKKVKCPRLKSKLLTLGGQY